MATRFIEKSQSRRAAPVNSDRSGYTFEAFMERMRVAIPSCCSGQFGHRRGSEGRDPLRRESQSRRAAPVNSDGALSEHAAIPAEKVAIPSCCSGQFGLELFCEGEQMQSPQSQSRRAAPVNSDHAQKLPDGDSASPERSQSRRAAPVNSDMKKNKTKKLRVMQSQSRRAAPVNSDSRPCNPSSVSRLRPLPPLPPLEGSKIASRQACFHPSPWLQPPFFSSVTSSAVTPVPFLHFGPGMLFSRHQGTLLLRPLIRAFW